MYKCVNGIRMNEWIGKYWLVDNVLLDDMSVVTSGIAQLSCLLLSVSDVQFGGLGSRVTLTCGGAHGGYILQSI